MYANKLDYWRKGGGQEIKIEAAYIDRQADRQTDKTCLDSSSHTK